MILTLYRHRVLLRELVQREVAQRYAGSAFGLFWAVLHPVFMIGLFAVVFGHLMAVRLHPDGSAVDYVVYLCSGMVPWFALQEGIHRASRIFLENTALVKKVAFPPALLVGQVVGAALIHLALSLAVFFLALLVVGRFPGAGIWQLVPGVAGLTLLLVGLATALSVLTVFFRDLETALPLLTTAWFWLTPIVYLPDMLPGWIRPLGAANPLVPILDFFRAAAGAVPPDGPAGAPWLAATILLGVTLSGPFLFRALARDLADAV